MTTREQKWALAERYYAQDEAELERNMDRRDIGCSSYQEMRVHAIERAGLGKHSPHCNVRSCIQTCPQYSAPGESEGL